MSIVPLRIRTVGAAVATRNENHLGNNKVRSGHSKPCDRHSRSCRQADRCSRW
jgi:hypothetical protein